MADRTRSKRKRAVALQYESREEIPKVLAAGIGEIAELILKIANSHSVPIREDENLTQLLSELEIGQPINRESFRLVAEIVTFLYHTDKAFKEKHSFLAGVVPSQDEPDQAVS